MKNNQVVYFDNPATSWPKPIEMLQAIKRYCLEVGGSPGRSGHRMSIEASRIIEDTREAICELFDFDDPSRVIFTKNITEALNICIFSSLGPDDHVITSSAEHNSVMRPLRHLEKKGAAVTMIRCDQNGLFDVRNIEKSIQDNTKMMIFAHASNVIGTLIPIEEIAALSSKRKIPFVIDCAQTAGALPIALDLKKYRNSILAFTGHKGLLGPTGTGGMLIGNDVDIEPLLFGGTGSRSDRDVQPDFLPDALESGTINVLGIAGLGASVRFLIDTGIENVRVHEKELLAGFFKGASEINQIKLYGTCDPEMQTGLISLNLKRHSPSTVGLLLDKKYHIMCRIGLHCNPNAHQSLGTFPDGTVRFGFSFFNTQKEVEYSLNALKELSRLV